MVRLLLNVVWRRCSSPLVDSSTRSSTFTSGRRERDALRCSVSDRVMTCHNVPRGAAGSAGAAATAAGAAGVTAEADAGSEAVYWSSGSMQRSTTPPAQARAYDAGSGLNGMCGLIGMLCAWGQRAREGARGGRRRNAKMRAGETDGAVQGLESPWRRWGTSPRAHCGHPWAHDTRAEEKWRNESDFRGTSGVCAFIRCAELHAGHEVTRTPYLRVEL